MTLVPPAELSGKIMTLIDQCTDRMVIISPYLQMSRWKKLTNRIINSQNRGVTYDWYYRSDQDYSYEFDTFNINGIPVENLHAKIYYNQTQALVTSMNLYEYSDSHSIDIGYLTETRQEYEEILQFVECYVKPTGVAPPPVTPLVAAKISGSPGTIVREKSTQINYCNRNLDRQGLESISVLVTDYFEQLVANGTLRNDQVIQRNLNLCVTEWCKSLDLEVDIRRSYDRIILQTTGGGYRSKWEQYKALRANTHRLEQAAGTSFNWGRQMKRIKWEFDNSQRTMTGSQLDREYADTVINQLNVAFGPLRIALQTLPTSGIPAIASFPPSFR